MVAGASLTPSAAASLRTPAAAADAKPSAPFSIRMPASVWYACPLECPGQLNPSPFGITTSNRCLYPCASSRPRKRAYAWGLRHKAVTAPRSAGLPMIATLIGNFERSAAFNRSPN